MQYMLTKPARAHIASRSCSTRSATLSRMDALRESLGLARIDSSLTASQDVTGGPVCGRFPGPLARPHILLIDPDFDTLDHIGQVLGQQGLGVTKSSVLLDVACVEQVAPDVIVVTADLDYAAVALGFLKAGLLRSALRNTPIIHTTVYPEVAGSLGDGSLIVLQKPYTPDVLLRVIDSVLATRAAAAMAEARPSLHNVMFNDEPGEYHS